LGRIVPVKPTVNNAGPEDTHLIAGLYTAGQFDGRWKVLKKEKKRVVSVSLGGVTLVVVPCELNGSLLRSGRDNVLIELFEIELESEEKTIRAGLVTSGVNTGSLPRDRESGCSGGRFIRGSGGL
jgi:hypothetical protein